ncbi:MAG: ParB/RepB/Spo0J family partition protein [Verrucomicrobiaceae bacterium]|nr:MAG: ParB/RepB/Spo0J family partition protein [Verrucomicrobiaceae bacterium]
MTTTLSVDAGSSPKSTSSPSPNSEIQQSGVSATLASVASPSVESLSSRQQGGPQFSMFALKLINTNRVCFSHMPNRTSEARTDDEFDGLCESMFATGGNMVPIHVRETGDQYELISGERRLHAAIFNGQPILAVVSDGTTEQDASLMRIVENANRKDLSPYERGTQLLYVLKKECGFSISHLARLMGIDKSVVSRALELAKLPLEIVQAFSSVRDIRYADAKPLHSAYEKCKDNVLVEAELIKAVGEKLKGPEVVKRLVEAANGGVAPCNTPEPIAIKFEDEVVGQLSHAKKGVQIAINLPLSDKQRIALAAHVELFVSRSVLRTPSPQRAMAKQQALEVQSIAVQVASQSTPAVVNVVINEA